jgi:hypothetical protein
MQATEMMTTSADMPETVLTPTQQIVSFAKNSSEWQKFLKKNIKKGMKIAFFVR